MGLMLLLVISAAALVGGIFMTVQAQNSALSIADNQENNVTTTPATTDQNNTIAVPWACMGMMPEIRGRGPHGFGGFGFEISSDFVQNVTNIAKADTDVQNLLNNGYNVTGVMPVIRNVIDGNGNVVTKATNATLILEKDITGRAFISLDLTQSKVAQVVIYTRTVINKP